MPPAPWPTSLPTLPDLIIETILGETFALKNDAYEKQPEEGEYDLAVQRILMSNKTYALGGGGFTPSNLRFSVWLRMGADYDTQLDWLTIFIRRCERARVLRWGDYHRNVYGAGGNRAVSPIGGGSRIEVQFVPADEGWVRTSTNTRILALP